MVSRIRNPLLKSLIFLRVCQGWWRWTCHDWRPFFGRCHDDWYGNAVLPQSRSHGESTSSGREFGGGGGLKGGEILGCWGLSTRKKQTQKTQVMKTSSCNLIPFKVTNQLLGGGFNSFFLCSFLFGEDSHFDEHIFQVGWFNHQPRNNFLKEGVLVKFSQHPNTGLPGQGLTRPDEGRCGGPKCLDLWLWMEISKYTPCN